MIRTVRDFDRLNGGISYGRDIGAIERAVEDIIVRHIDLELGYHYCEQRGHDTTTDRASAFVQLSRWQSIARYEPGR